MAARVNVSIDTVSAATNNVRTANFSKGPGSVAWATVSPSGNVDVTGAPANSPAADISWTLPSGFSFNATAPFSPDSGDFSVSSGKGTSTLVVSDTNNDPANTNNEYTLTLDDGTTIDPMVINR